MSLDIAHGLLGAGAGEGLLRLAQPMRRPRLCRGLGGRVAGLALPGEAEVDDLGQRAVPPVRSEAGEEQVWRPHDGVAVVGEVGLDPAEAMVIDGEELWH